MITDINTPKITKTQSWNADAIRRMCIKENWYTKGDCEAYDTMLDYVSDHPCTDINVFIVARDICEHTSNQTIDNIMFVIARECIFTFYDLEYKED